MTKSTYDDSGMQQALRQMLDIKRNLDPAAEVKKRAKNVCLRLVGEFKKAAPSKEEIQAVGSCVKVRARINAFTKTSKAGKMKGLTRAQKVKKELSARVAARTLTAAGWFPAAVALGASPRLNSRVRGERLGSIKQELSGSSPAITMTNAQPGAAQTDDRGNGAMQKALDAEVADMCVYIERRQEEAARKAGL